MFEQAIEIIRTSAVADGQDVKLTCGKLDGDLYKQIDALFCLFRGKWVGGKKAAHTFPEPITGQVVIDSILAGNVPKKNQYSLFPTLDPVIDLMLDELNSYCPDPEEAYRFLEPSAGTGGIAKRLRAAYPNATIDTVEIDQVNVRILQSQGFTPLGSDFLTLPFTCKYDAVVMNPPFNGNEYVKHIEKAFTLIAQHGVVISVVPGAIIYNNGALPLLHRIHEQDGIIEALPDGSFKSSGFNGDTIMVSIPGYRPDTIPYTGYASRRIAILSVAFDNNFEFSTELSQLIRSQELIQVDADGYPGDAFAGKVRQLYQNYMLANRLTYCVSLDDWEWRQLAGDIAEYAEIDFGIPVERPALTVKMPDEKPVSVTSLPKPAPKAKRVEYTQASLFQFSQPGALCLARNDL